MFSDDDLGEAAGRTKNKDDHREGRGGAGGEGGREGREGEES